MKKITALFAVFVAATVLFAQDLDSVCAALASRPNTTGDFTQIKTISSNGRQLKSTGKFIISRKGIMWQTEKPFPSALILTEDSMIQIAANGNKSVMSGKDNQIFTNISATLSSVFSGDASALRANFDCEFTGADSASAGSANHWSIKLTPKDSTIASVMNCLVLSGSVFQGVASLEALEMQEASGNTIRYEFSNQKYPEELSADEKKNFITE